MGEEKVAEKMNEGIINTGVSMAGTPYSKDPKAGNGANTDAYLSKRQELKELTEKGTDYNKSEDELAERAHYMTPIYNLGASFKESNDNFFPPIVNRLKDLYKDLVGDLNRPILTEEKRGEYIKSYVADIDKSLSECDKQLSEKMSDIGKSGTQPLYVASRGTQLFYMVYNFKTNIAKLLSEEDARGLLNDDIVEKLYKIDERLQINDTRVPNAEPGSSLWKNKDEKADEMLIPSDTPVQDAQAYNIETKAKPNQRLEEIRMSQKNLDIFGPDIEAVNRNIVELEEALDKYRPKAMGLLKNLDKADYFNGTIFSVNKHARGLLRAKEKYEFIKAMQILDDEKFREIYGKAKEPSIREHVLENILENLKNGTSPMSERILMEINYAVNRGLPEDGVIDMYVILSSVAPGRFSGKDIYLEYLDAIRLDPAGKDRTVIDEGYVRETENMLTDLKTKTNKEFIEKWMDINEFRPNDRDYHSDWSIVRMDVKGPFVKNSLVPRFSKILERMVAYNMMNLTIDKLNLMYYQNKSLGEILYGEDTLKKRIAKLYSWVEEDKNYVKSLEKKRGEFDDMVQEKEKERTLQLSELEKRMAEREELNPEIAFLAKKIFPQSSTDGTYHLQRPRKDNPYLLLRQRLKDANERQSNVQKLRSEEERDYVNLKRHLGKDGGKMQHASLKAETDALNEMIGNLEVELGIAEYKKLDDYKKELEGILKAAKEDAYSFFSSVLSGKPMSKDIKKELQKIVGAKEKWENEHGVAAYKALVGEHKAIEKERTQDRHALEDASAMMPYKALGIHDMEQARGEFEERMKPKNIRQPGELEAMLNENTEAFKDALEKVFDILPKYGYNIKILPESETPVQKPTPSRDEKMMDYFKKKRKMKKFW